LALAMFAASAVLTACGGSGGSSREPQGPPPPTFSIVVETGLAIGQNFGNIARIGDVALVPVSESESGIDLNGDADTLDSVLHRLQVSTNTSINLGLAIRGPIIASDQRFVFLVAELDQGADVSGDGDLADSVWHLFDPTSPISPANPFNTTLATPLSGKPGIGAAGGMVLIVSEAAQRADFNGDGDMIDDIAFGIEHVGQSIVPLGMPPHAAGTPLIARNNRVLVCGSEAGAGTDLTGDTDTLDVVLGAVTFDGPGPPQVTAIGSIVQRAVVPTEYALTDTMAVYLVDEASSNATDLNMDGDTNDGVIALFDLANGTGEFMPVASAVSPFPLAVSSTAAGLGTSANRVLFGIDEGAQGKDLNGDQDTADSILAWVDTAGTPSVARVVGVALGGTRPTIEKNIGLISVHEAGSQLVVGIDHNFDGDISDQVAFRIDVTSAPAVLTNLGRAVAEYALQGTDAILWIPESAQANIDRNGDTDTGDIIPTYADLSLPSPTFLSLGVAAHMQSMRRVGPSDVRIALQIPEQPLTSRADLNGDGDSLDNALLWFDLDPVTSPPRVKAPTPVFVDITSFIPRAPIEIDENTLLFPTNEFMFDRDLNGDDDKNDTLLRIVKRPPPEP
jgi:hypothetical protein